MPTLQHIFIRSPTTQTTNGGRMPEWEMIEFQGTLETKPIRDHMLNALTLGKLSLRSSQQQQKTKKRKISLLNASSPADPSSSSSNDNERVELVIGKQLLEGKRVPLQKPLAVVQKKRGNGESVISIDNEEGKVTNSVAYEIVGICRHRLHFASRPESIAMHSSPKGSPTKLSAASTSPIRDAFKQSMKPGAETETSATVESKRNGNSKKTTTMPAPKPKVDFFALHSRKNKKRKKKD